MVQLPIPLHNITLYLFIEADKVEKPAEGEEPVEGEAAENMEEDDLEDAEEGNEKKYVKKEYIARPYNSEFV